MSRPWMPLYPADYLADTSHLTTIEHGAYCLLIMNYWSRGGLPGTDEDLARITRLSLKDWLKIRPRIYALFRPGWTHKRIEAELTIAADKYERLAAAGKRGGHERARRYPRGDADDSQAIARPTSDPSQAMARPWLPQPQPHNSSSQEGSSPSTAGEIHRPTQDRTQASAQRTRSTAPHGRIGGRA